MACIENLKPKTTLTKEEAKKLGSLGGIASGKVRAERKTFKEIFNLLLQDKSIDNDNITNNQAMSLTMIAEAMKGNVKAFEVIRDTIGEKPVDKVDTNLNGKLEIIMPDEMKELAK